MPQFPLFAKASLEDLHAYALFLLIAAPLRAFHLLRPFATLVLQRANICITHMN
jgi:hypothetical protein